MFDGVADRYDTANGILTLGIDGSWRNAVRRAVDPKPGQRILDLAAGTGKSSIPLAEAGANVTAVDFSAGMIAVGRERYPELEFVEADITALPFADGTFDTVTISFGLRNVNDVSKGLSEMFRVLRPGGKLVICEFSKVEGKVTGPAYRFYLNKVLPKAAGLISHNKDAYKYLAESIEAWPKPQELLQMISDTGFVAPSYRMLTMGIVAIHRAFKPQVAGHNKQIPDPVVEKKTTTKRVASKRPAAKKATAKQAAPKKAAPKKPAAKKATPKKSTAAKAATTKPATPKATPTKDQPVKDQPVKNQPVKPAPNKSAAPKNESAKPAEATQPENTQTPQGGDEQ